MLSIKPNYAIKIFEGEKKYEYRRVIFKKNVQSVIVYASSPLSAVIGEFDIEKIISEDLDALWLMTRSHSGISKHFFYDYFSDKQTGYAIKVSRPTLYKDYLPLYESYGVRPPQSFMYL